MGITTLKVVQLLYYKTKLESVSLSCKSHRSKIGNIKTYPQIQCTDASDHIYVSQWPVLNVG